MKYHLSYIQNNSVHRNLELLFYLLKLEDYDYFNDTYEMEVKYFQDLLYLYNKYEDYKFCNTDFKAISLYNYFNCNIKPLPIKNIILGIFEIIYNKMNLILLSRKKNRFSFTKYNIVNNYINELADIIYHFETTNYGMLLCKKDY